MDNNTEDTRAQPLAARFDSNSFVIRVNNHASKCMSNRRQHFVGPIQPLPNKRVQGVGGLLQVKGRGTIRWRIEDDGGRIHNVLIHGALYIPDLPICLLCPQHWSQQTNDNFPQKNGTWCGTYASECVLHWDQQQFKRTVAWDPSTNTDRLRSATGANTYRVFASTVESATKCETHEHVAYRCVAYPSTGPHLNSDEEDKVQIREVPDPLSSPLTQRLLPGTDSPSTSPREENLTDLTT